MATTFHIAGLVALVLACLVCVAVLVVGLPGTFLIVATALVYAFATDFAAVGWPTIAWLVGLALLGEGVELASAALSAGDRPPSRRVTACAVIGGILGGIAGVPIAFGLGALPGALAGAFTGATIAAGWEGQGLVAAVRHGLAAMRGRLLGFVAKTAIAVVMVIILVTAAM